MSDKSPRMMAKQAREQTQRWLTMVNIHWAGVGVLGVVCLYLLVQMGLSWRVANTQDAEALSNQQTSLKAAEIAAKPLQGLDVKLATADHQADKFYLDRLPVSYSQLATELGVLKNKAHVRLSRVNYSQPVKSTAGATAATANLVPDSGPDHLTEVLMDASLAGEYRELVTFINSLERDKVFFLIDGVTLTGQQTGQVSLRLRMTTYLRGKVAADEVDKANADAAGSPTAEMDKAVEAQERKAAGGAR